MNRLLSEQEIYDIIARLDVAKFQPECIIWPLFEAQDAKTTAALIAWLEEPCDKHRGIHGWFELHRYLCAECWQELKESAKHD